MEETAISSALAADVTARKSNTSIAAAPAFPSRDAAAADAGRPAETSAGESIRISGSPLAVNATAAKPRVVAKVKGIANLEGAQTFGPYQNSVKPHTRLNRPKDRP